MSRPPRITLICYETPGLHLGPGLPGDPDCIDFIPVYAGPGVTSRYGLATIEADDPLHSQKMAWTHSFGCPSLEIVDPEADELPAGTIADPDATCPGCGGAFADRRAVDRHLLQTHCHPKNEVSD